MSLPSFPQRGQPAVPILELPDDAPVQLKNWIGKVRFTQNMVRWFGLLKPEIVSVREDMVSGLSQLFGQYVQESRDADRTLAMAKLVGADDPLRQVLQREWSTFQFLQNTRANRANYPAAQFYPAMFLETDTLLVYYSSGTAWKFLAGTWRDTLANLPGTLGANDFGLNYDVSDYDHMLLWTGGAFQWGHGEVGSGFYAMFESAPSSTGTNAWAICDGSTVARLNPTGTTTNVTLDNLGTPAYLKGGTASAAVAGSGGTTANAATGVTVDTHPDHIHDDASSLASPDLFAADVTAAGVAGRTGVQLTTGGAALSLTHTVNDPQHAHGPGTLELRNKQARLYFRR